MVLAAIALLYVFSQVMVRFGNILALFIVGAIVAYIVNPAVTWVTARVGKRMVGTAVVYVGAAVALVLLGVSIVQPLVTESASLVQALRNPSSASMTVLNQMGSQSRAVGVEVRSQRDLAESGKAIPIDRVQQVRTAIGRLQNDLATLGSTSNHPQPRPGVSKAGAAAPAQMRIPPSYLAPLEKSTAALKSDYQLAVGDPAAPDVPVLGRSIADADKIASQTKALHKTLSTTPILLLDAQTWADQHDIGINVTQSSGQVVKQISSQVSSILNNTAGALSQTATLLLDLGLILIISIYFVVDGQSMVQDAIGLVPAAYHKQATFFVSSLDSVLGGYIRAQILLALLAGVLAALGAAVLGVPYALIIGVSTFLLQLVPVIGSMVVYIVPMIIALLFTSMPTPVIFLAYLVIMEQVVTNVIGPRVNSKSVGVHPLVAMAAALVGYSMGGFLTSFLAVPTVGLINVVGKEAYNSWQAGKQTSRQATTSATSTPDDSSTATARDASPDESSAATTGESSSHTSTEPNGRVAQEPVATADSSGDKSPSAT